jgi:hypothetical protein
MGAIGVELRICLLAASRECDVTGKLEVIAWSIGLVPRNALVLTVLTTAFTGRARCHSKVEASAALRQSPFLGPFMVQ